MKKGLITTVLLLMGCAPIVYALSLEKSTERYNEAVTMYEISRKRLFEDHCSLIEMKKGLGQQIDMSQFVTFCDNKDIKSYFLEREGKLMGDLK